MILFCAISSSFLLANLELEERSGLVIYFEVIEVAVIEFDLFLSHRGIKSAKCVADPPQIAQDFGLPTTVI